MEEQINNGMATQQNTTSSEKHQSTDKCYTVAKSPKHHTEWKQPDQKGMYYVISCLLNSRIGNTS